MDRIEECKKCKRPFTVTGGGYGPMQDYEDIDCPHCGDMWGREKARGVYISKSLTPEQEKEYHSRKT
jgi:hypothetical protein